MTIAERSKKITLDQKAKILILFSRFDSLSGIAGDLARQATAGLPFDSLSAKRRDTRILDVKILGQIIETTKLSSWERKFVRRNKFDVPADKTYLPQEDTGAIVGDIAGLINNGDDDEIML